MPSAPRRLSAVPDDPREDPRFNPLETSQYDVSRSPRHMTDVLVLETRDSSVPSNSKFANPPISERPALSREAQRREGIAYAQVNNHVLEREQGAMAKEEEFPPDEVQGLAAALLTCRRQLGEATSQLYADQTRSFTAGFQSAVSTAKLELDAQQAERASAVKIRKPMPPGYMSPRQLQKARPDYGWLTHAFFPPNTMNRAFSTADSDAKFLGGLPANSPRRLPRITASRKDVTEASLAEDRKWGPRWLPVTENIPRLKLPGALGTQEHIYSKLSPRGLMPSLSPRDPVLRQARQLDAEGLLFCRG